MTTLPLIIALSLGCFNCHGIPDFCANPTQVVAESGLWTQVATSGPNEVVVIPAGISVEIPEGTIVTVHSLAVYGRLIQRGELRYVNLQCWAGGEELWLDGASEVIRDVAPTDPAQWGTGHITSGKSTYSGSTRQKRITALGNLSIGQTVIPVEDAADWAVGDEIVIPDVRQNTDAIEVDQHEYRTVTAVSPTSITVAALAFKHDRPLHPNGSVYANIPLFNFTRGIKVTSENPNGTRGHWAAVGRADVRLTGVEFVGLGRTEYSINGQQEQTKQTRNQIGRYAGPHLHHVYGPVSSHNGYQWEITGCVCRDINRNGWGFTIHQTHYGILSDSLAWGGKPDGALTLVSAGIVTEDGPEIGNQIIDCIAGDCLSGIWAIGVENTYRQNLAIDCHLGYEFGRVGTASPSWNYPLNPGDEPASYVSRPEKDFIPVVFSENEAIACRTITVNWGHTRNQGTADGAPIVFRNGPMTGWNCRRAGNGYYDNIAVAYDGWVIHANPAINEKDTYCFTFGGNSCSTMELNDCQSIGHVQGIFYRARGSGSRLRVNRCKFWNDSCVWVQTLQQTPRFGNMLAVLKDCEYYPRKPIANWYAFNAVGTKDGHPNLLLLNQLFVDGYNGDPDDDFQVYSLLQLPTQLMVAAQDTGPYMGLTNQQAFDQFGVCMLGELAPPETRPGINGRIRDMGPPPIIVALRALMLPEMLLEQLEEWVLTATPAEIAALIAALGAT